MGLLLTPLLAVANPLAKDESEDEAKVAQVGGCDLGFELRGEEDDVGSGAREEEEQDALDERDEGDVEEEEDEAVDLAHDDFPVLLLAQFTLPRASGRISVFTIGSLRHQCRSRLFASSCKSDGPILL